jgi:hypothetical protein
MPGRPSFAQPRTPGRPRTELAKTLLTPDEKRRLDVACERHGLGAAAIVRRALLEYLDRRGIQDPTPDQTTIGVDDGRAA